MLRTGNPAAVPRKICWGGAQAYLKPIMIELLGTGRSLATNQDMQGPRGPWSLLRGDPLLYRLFELSSALWRCMWEDVESCGMSLK